MSRIAPTCTFDLASFHFIIRTCRRQRARIVSSNAPMFGKAWPGEVPRTRRKQGGSNRPWLAALDSASSSMRARERCLNVGVHEAIRGGIVLRSRARLVEPLVESYWIGRRRIRAHASGFQVWPDQREPLPFRGIEPGQVRDQYDTDPLNALVTHSERDRCRNLLLLRFSLHVSQAMTGIVARSSPIWAKVKIALSCTGTDRSVSVAVRRRRPRPPDR